MELQEALTRTPEVLTRYHVGSTQRVQGARKGESMGDTTSEELEFPNTIFLAEPERSPYVADIAGVHYIPLKGDEPNWFHRKMQYFVLGVRWKRR